MCPFQRGYTEEQIRLLTCLVLYILWMCQELSIVPQPYPGSLEYRPDYWLSSPSVEALNHQTGVISLFSLFLQQFIIATRWTWIFFYCFGIFCFVLFLV